VGDIAQLFSNGLFYVLSRYRPNTYLQRRKPTYLHTWAHLVI